MKKHPPQIVLLQYFERQLSELQIEILEGHLLECVQCTLVVEDFKKIKQAQQTPSKKFLLTPQLKSRILNQAQSALQANKTRMMNEEKKNGEKISRSIEQLLGLIPRAGVPVAAGIALSIILLRPAFNHKTEHSIFSDNYRGDNLAKEYFYQEDNSLPNREIIFSLGDGDE